MKKQKPLKNPDTFLQENETKPKSEQRIKMLANGLIFDPEKYEYREDWVEAKTPVEAHSTAELVEFAKQGKIEIQANILGAHNGERAMTKMNTKQFVEACGKRDSKKLREAGDAFNGFDELPSSPNIVGGADFVPLLGGPFNKQLYYRDMLRMMSASFFAYHHDPVARDIVSMTVDFTMGRGIKVAAFGKDAEKAQLLWDAFAKVNDLEQQGDHLAAELAIYGEIMLWKLPHNQTKISFNPVQGEKVPHGIIPRVRLVDPSNIAEIITVPEDMIKGAIAYVWLAPTQYQMYTDGRQPSTKFIYTQIPADQILHFKVNSVSNEKRGRSDYFPALGYMKRLRDSVNYSLVAQQKASAWCIDTTIKGNDDDISQYISDQQALGAIPPAGSEFVHTEAIKREYLSNSATGKSSDSPTFNWCMNMIAMSSGFPIAYFGTHLSGQGTRASALVSTEPIAKRLERRQNVYQRIWRALFNYVVVEYFGLNADCEIIFPELITQDRSALFKDLMLAQTAGWVAKETAANLAAKEFDLDEYDYRVEQEKINNDPIVPPAGPTSTSPLTAPAQNGQTGKSNGTMTAPEKQQVKSNLRRL